MIPVDGGDVLQQGVVERPPQFAQHQGGRDVSMADRGHEPAYLAPLGSYMPPSKRGRHKSKLYARSTDLLAGVGRAEPAVASMARQLVSCPERRNPAFRKDGVPS